MTTLSYTTLLARDSISSLLNGLELVEKLIGLVEDKIASLSK